MKTIQNIILILLFASLFLVGCASSFEDCQAAAMAEYDRHNPQPSFNMEHEEYTSAYAIWYDNRKSFAFNRCAGVKS